MKTSLLTGIRIRLYAVLFYADRFCRWLLTDSPGWLRWLSNLSLPKKRANREREDHIYFEAKNGNEDNSVLTLYDEKDGARHASRPRTFFC